MSRLRRAKRLLADEETCASVVYMSALAIFGADLQEFEYETLRLECRRKDISVPPQNWEELFAALALRGDGRFAIDANTFENTIVVFNGGEADARQIQPTVPAHIAWAMKEADLIVADLVRGALEDYLDYEPVSYSAVMLKAHGMVCTTGCLEFCAERLDELTPEHDELRAEVKKAWAEQTPEDAPRLEFQEDEVGVQLAHLHAVREYVSEREHTQRRQLSRLLR